MRDDDARPIRIFVSRLDIHHAAPATAFHPVFAALHLSLRTHNAPFRRFVLGRDGLIVTDHAQNGGDQR
ncbi:hypothetical protein [Bradyrhizobium diazoefficiens]|uniref:hypothetical protein n=1 Tax=Bradyrhizobium diazoefficiens TaxID=1355477 RepID=UPI001B5BD107|nr:hypothetical protein [Bradyrhizobium japonicum]